MTVVPEFEQLPWRGGWPVAPLTYFTELQVHLDIPIFLSNAAAAFGLNMSVFMLIGKTSALTMNIAGVIKDWLLIGLSVLIFKAQVDLLIRHPSTTLVQPQLCMQPSCLWCSQLQMMVNTTLTT